MLPMDLAMRLLKGKRRFLYTIWPEQKGAEVARTALRRRPVVEPMPGMDSSMVLVDGTPMILQEAEAGGFIYPEDEEQFGLGYNLPGLGFEASLANVHPSDKNPNTFDRDTDFSRDDTFERFMDEVAPKMAHETGHALDSQWKKGSFAQAEMPAHVLEVATREAMDRRRGRDPKYSIIEDAASRLKERLYRPGADFPTTIQTPEDNPDYVYDITDDQIISGEPMDLAMRLLKQDLPDWTKDLFDSKGNLKNYSPSLDEEPKEIPTPPLHPGRTRLDINEHGKQFYPSQYNQQVNLPYGYEREMSIDEVIDSHGILRNMPREAAEEYVKQHPFEAFRHLNTKDSRKSPFQLNLQRLTEFEDYDDWDESDKNDDITSHAFDQPSFLNTPWNEKTGFTRSEPMDLAFRLLKDRKSPEAFRHKKEYDSKYQKTPERRKYQRELHRERRKRGMYGDKSGKDISHTEGGKFTVESQHANRGRHFKDRGTLRPITKDK